MKMALFPAYNSSTTKSENGKEETTLTWLKNESCPPEVAVVGASFSESHDIKSSTAFSTNDHSPKRSNDDTDERNSLKRAKLNESSESDSTFSQQQEGFQSHDSDSPTPTAKKYKKKLKRKKSKNKKKSSSKSSKAKGNTDHGDYFEIPFHPGENKNIFLDASFQFRLSQDFCKALYIDKMPDKNNSIFSNTHYSQVANYTRKSSRPLGMCFHEKKKTKKETRYFSKSFRHLPNPIATLRVGCEFKDVSYIPLQLTHEEENKLQELVSKLTQTDSCKMNPPRKVTAYDSFSNENESPVEVDMERKYWQNQIKSFNERLNKEPNNINLWLEFVDIQDDAVCYSLEGGDRKEGNKRSNYKLLLERKISILEIAIGKNIRSLELQLKRLKLGEDIWDNRKLNIEWDKLIMSFPANMNVWHQYLIFHQTFFSTFQLERVIQAYEKCSKRLCQMRDGTFVSHKVPENITYILIDLSVQLAFVWYQGGYMERSVALFQALIELSLFCPKQLQTDQFNKNSKIVLFEAFWDSKAPRVGEKDHVGWEKFMERREPVEFMEEILEGKHDEEDDIISLGGTKPDLWIRLESSRESNHWLPWQQDPDLCEDTERMVSFATLKKHLFSMSTEDEALYLVIRFLTFLGVPIPDNVLVGLFTSSESRVFYPLQLDTLKTLVPTNVNRNKGIFDFPMIGPSVLENDSYFDFVCEIINQLMPVVSVLARPKLAIIFIRLLSERAMDQQQSTRTSSSSAIKTYKKSIKNLLKQNEFRGDLEIYFEYAQFERRLSCYDEAYKIYSAALSLGLGREGSDPFMESPLALSLWRHLSAMILLLFEREENVSQDNVNLMLNVISSFVLEGTLNTSSASPNGGQILRSKKRLNLYIETELNHLNIVGDCIIKTIQFSIHLLSVLQLLTVGFKPACLIFEEAIKKIDGRISTQEEPLGSSHHNSSEMLTLTLKEEVYEKYIWLVDVASKLQHISPFLPFPQSSVRTILESALSLAPNNITFLQKFSEYQGWRNLLCDHVSTPSSRDSILIMIFKLLPQIKKVMRMMASTEYGVVSAGYQLENKLEWAVSLPCGSKCPLLWRLYLRLMETSRPSKLKQIADRAIHSCPSAKCLYMDYIALVPEAMPDVLRLMMEKGIRVRVPLEELDLLLEQEHEEEEKEEEEECETKCEKSENQKESETDDNDL